MIHLFFLQIQFLKNCALNPLLRSGSGGETGRHMQVVSNENQELIHLGGARRGKEIGKERKRQIVVNVAC